MNNDTEEFGGLVILGHGCMESAMEKLQETSVVLVDIVLCGVLYVECEEWL